MSQPSRTTIPMLDLTPEIEELWDELNAAFQRVLRSGQFILGPEVEAFEDEVADYLGTKHTIGVNSGTDALVIGLRALGIGPGDEVITTPFSFFATAESISNVGATPVFVDIDERTFNIDPALIEPAITPRTKAIVPVHLYGRPCEMDSIMDIAERNSLKVIEDCAQSFGARFHGKQTGTIGHVSAFSFFPSKNLGGFGDGGLVATDDEGVARLARKLRSHGSVKKYRNERLGYNSRLDALQAALLRTKLPHIEHWNRGRLDAARRYGGLLDQLPGIVTPEIVDGHVFHQYTIRETNGQRDALITALSAAGIDAVVYYPVPQNELPVYSGGFGHQANSRRAAHEVLSLPVWPRIAPQMQVRIARVLEDLSRDAEALTCLRP